MEVVEQDVDVAVNLSSIANVNRSKGPCPLCFDFQIKSGHEYQSHVGHHLEQLALFILPTQDDENDDHEFSDDESSQSQDSEFEAEETEHLDPLAQKQGDQGDQGVLDSVQDIRDEVSRPVMFAPAPRRSAMIDNQSKDSVMNVSGVQFQPGTGTDEKLMLMSGYQQVVVDDLAPTVDEIRRKVKYPSRSSSMEALSGHEHCTVTRNKIDPDDNPDDNPDDMNIFVKGTGSLTIGNAQLDMREGGEIAIHTKSSDIAPPQEEKGRHSESKALADSTKKDSNFDSSIQEL